MGRNFRSEARRAHLTEKDLDRPLLTVKDRSTGAVHELKVRDQPNIQLDIQAEDFPPGHPM